MRGLVTALRPGWRPIALAALAASCVHGQPAETTATAAPELRRAGEGEGLSATAIPPPPELRDRGRAHRGVTGEPGSWREPSRDASPDMTIDDELARLGHVLASLRAARGEATDAPPPRAGLAAWERMLDRLDAYLDQPPSGTPAVQLVRAKVTIETELDLEREAWRFPGHLTARLRSRLAYMEHRIESSRESFVELPEGHDEPVVVWPVEPVVVTSEFGWRRDPFHGRRRFHYGVDLKATFGQLVSSAGPGTVEWAEWNGGHGKHVEILHPGGWRTRYSHLAKILVREGDEVEAGDPVGLAGATGRATGPHLHFEVWRLRDVRDPAEVLGAPPVFIGDVAYREPNGHARPR